jgi:hypothetical protein
LYVPQYTKNPINGQLGGRTVDLVSALGARLGEHSITLAGAECALHRKGKSIEQIDWRVS